MMETARLRGPDERMSPSTRTNQIIEYRAITNWEKNLHTITWFVISSKTTSRADVWWLTVSLHKSSLFILFHFDTLRAYCCSKKYANLKDKRWKVIPSALAFLKCDFTLPASKESFSKYRSIVSQNIDVILFHQSRYWIPPEFEGRGLFSRQREQFLLILITAHSW